MAFVAMANYSQPGYELGYAIKFMRMFMLIGTAIFGIWGFAAGIFLTLYLLLSTKTKFHPEILRLIQSRPSEDN